MDSHKLCENISRIAQEDLAEQKVFGSSYCVMQDEKILIQKHFGVSGEAQSAPVGDDTIYRLASMTKPITAVAMLILMERGLISPDTPVKEILPMFSDIEIVTPEGVTTGKSLTDVTVKHLLTHTSGIGSLRPVALTAEDKLTIDGLVSRYCRAGLEFEPFTRQAYSGVAAFDVLAAILERITGEDMETFLKREIFEPCQMTDTTFVPSEEQWNRVIGMHNRIDGKNCLAQMEYGCVFEDYPATHKLAGAGLISTLVDYTKFAQMLLHCGKTESKTIVTAETFAMLSVPYVPETIMPGNQSWGFGVRVITKPEYGTLPPGSYGWSGAYGSHFWIDPENRIVAVFMKNSRIDGGSGNESARKFETAVYGSFSE